ncbi:MAG TPA: hypothetical protein VLL08_01305 [Kineosporiaceae bacterium]|nr:hypothetical protein [Kineosporiaceae bacterium]
MLKGGLIGESLRSGLNLDDVPLTVHRIERISARDPVGGQPGVWTLVTFTADEECAETIAERFSSALDGPGWYIDFHTDTEVFVVFPNRVFRYPKGDRLGRAAAVDYGRAGGVPDSQLDWDE